MTAAHHLSEAEACLNQLGEQDDDSSVERSLLGRSLAHSALSIARNLETVAARWAPPADPADVVEAEILDGNPLHTAAALLEQIAIGDDGEQRERTIARLMLGPQAQARLPADPARRRGAVRLRRHGRDHLHRHRVAGHGRHAPPAVPALTCPLAAATHSRRPARHGGDG